MNREERIDDVSPVPKRRAAQSPPWRHRPPGRLLKISAPATRGETNRGAAQRQLLGEVGRLELRCEVRLKSLREKKRRFELE
jgi:hypothetical protein